MEYRVSINITRLQKADSAVEAASDALRQFLPSGTSTTAKTNPAYQEETKVVITVSTPRFSHEPIQREPSRGRV